MEEAPVVPDDWAAATVPLASLVRGSATEPTRVLGFLGDERPWENSAALAGMVSRGLRHERLMACDLRDAGASARVSDLYAQLCEEARVRP